MKSIKKYQDGGGVGSSNMYSDLTRSQRSSSIAQGVGGIGDIGVGIYNAIEGSRQAKQATAEIERLKAAAPVLTTPSQFYEAQKMAYDQRLVDLQKEAVARNVSQSLQSLGQLGGRAALGGVSALQTGANRAMQEIAMDAARQRMAATSQLGAARERELGRVEGRYQQDLGFERDRYAAGRAAIGQGIGQAVGGVSSAIAGFTGGAMDAAKLAATASGIPVGKDGMVVKTPGEFSHSKNPIDIVKGGAKIGEMTGGEYIFNPKQMDKIKGFVAGGDKEKLHTYVKSLIKKFNKK